jgi:hypothetical protein
MNSAKRVDCSRPCSTLLENFLKLTVNFLYTSTSFDKQQKRNAYELRPRLDLIPLVDKQLFESQIDQVGIVLTSYLR